MNISIPFNSNTDDDVIFVLDHGPGAARIVMTTRGVHRSSDRCRMPLWWHQPASETALTAIAIWLGEQRALWQSWHGIAERYGANALNAEISRLWSKSGIEACTAVALTHSQDTHEIVLSAMLVTRNSELVRHRFETIAHNEAFTAFFAGDVSAISTFLLLEGALGGPAHLGRILDRIADGEMAERKSKARGEVGKQKRKAA